MKKNPGERINEMITYVGYFLIFLGVVDYLSSTVGTDFYGIFGIYLEGVAYEYSSYAAGLFGFILIVLDRDKDIKHLVEMGLEKDESLISADTVSVRKGGFFGGIESGVFFVTNKRLGYIANYSQSTTGDSFDTQAVGDRDLVWDIGNVSSARATTTTVIIQSADEEFKLLPGPWKTKKIAETINSIMG